MKKEDIEFLKELQSELKSQPRDGQGEPRFWTIGEKVLVPSEFGSPYISDSDNDSYYSLDEYVDEITAIFSTDDYTDEDREEWKKVNKTDPDAVVNFVQPYFEDSDIDICWLEEKQKVVEDTFFLTKRETKKHIENYGYHYREPFIYAMTALRSPEFERFLKLFTEMDINDIKIEE